MITNPAIDNPLLADRELPLFPAIEPAHVLPAIEAVLAAYQARVDALVADAAARDFDTLIAPLEAMEEWLARTWAPVSHLHGEADSPELREAYGAALEKITAFGTELGQNRALYEAVRAVREGPGFATLDRARQTLVEDSLRDFRLSGVALEEPARTRFRDIQNEMSKVETEFEEAVLDATDAWTRPLSEAELAGLPDTARGMLAQAASSRGQAGWVATLKGPVVQAILTHADDRTLRAEIYQAYNTRASDQGPNAGKHDNSARIDRILALRHEAAARLGFATPAQSAVPLPMAGCEERPLADSREPRANACSPSCASSPTRPGRWRRRSCSRCASSPPPSWAWPSCNPGTSATPARNCARRAMRSRKRTSSPTSRCRK